MKFILSCSSVMEHTLKDYQIDAFIHRRIKVTFNLSIDSSEVEFFKPKRIDTVYKSKIKKNFDQEGNFNKYLFKNPIPVILSLRVLFDSL